MDANKDIWKGGEVLKTLLDSVGLREVILDFHRNLSPPAAQNGDQLQEPIDRIWAIISRIAMTRGRYLGFGEGCSFNHCILWFDASLSAGSLRPASAGHGSSETKKIISQGSTVDRQVSQVSQTPNGVQRFQVSVQRLHNRCKNRLEPLAATGRLQPAY